MQSADFLGKRRIIKRSWGFSGGKRSVNFSETEEHRLKPHRLRGPGPPSAVATAAEIRADHPADVRLYVIDGKDARTVARFLGVTTSRVYVSKFRVTPYLRWELIRMQGAIHRDLRRAATGSDIILPLQ